jgi:hypothetical protein
VRSARFSGARCSYFGLDGACTDKLNLRDIFVGKATSAKQIERWIHQAIAQKKWLVLEFHDVLPEGGDEYSLTPQKLHRIVTYIKNTGIQVVTLEEGIRLMNSGSKQPSHETDTLGHNRALPRPAREIYLEISVRLGASGTSLVSDLKKTQAWQPSAPLGSAPTIGKCVLMPSCFYPGVVLRTALEAV